MIRQARFSEARTYGYARIVVCDRCGRWIDAIGDPFWIALIDAGSLYAGKPLWCWECHACAQAVNGKKR